MKCGGIFMQKMITCILCLFLLSGSIHAKTSPNDIHQLQHIHAILGQNNDQMEWKVTIKDSLRVEEAKNVVKNVENRHLVTSTYEENEIQYMMDINEFKNMDIQVHVHHYKDEEQAEIIINIHGSKWNGEVAQTYNAFVAHIKDFYITQKAHVFACLSSTYSATISPNQLEKQIIHGLSLQHVSKGTDPLTDPQKQIDFSGYSPYMEQTIRLANDKEFNVQVVIKKMDREGFLVTIGTPILIDEY